MVEFSSSAYMTDTQLSRLKRIPSGVYASQRLSFLMFRKTFRGKPGSERYSGNPTVADRRGACGNVDDGGTRHPPRRSKERVMVTLCLKSRAPQFYPDPGKQCHHRQPGTLHPDPPQREALTHVVDPRGLPAAHDGPPLGLQRLDRRGEQADLLPGPLATTQQGGREWRAVPLVHLGKLGVHIALQRERHALTRHEPLDAMAHPRPVTRRRRQCTVELTAVVLLDAGHTLHTCRSPALGRRSIVRRVWTSSRAVCARRWRRWTSMRVEAMTWCVTPGATKERWNQNPSRPASSQLTTPASSGQPKRCCARVLSFGNVARAPAESVRARGWCAMPLVTPHFHVCCPSATARDSVGWGRLSCPMRGVAGVAIVSLLLENTVAEGADRVTSRYTVGLKATTSSTSGRKAHRWRAAAPLRTSVLPHSLARYRLSVLNMPHAQVPLTPQR